MNSWVIFYPLHHRFVRLKKTDIKYTGNIQLSLPCLLFSFVDPRQQNSAFTYSINISFIFNNRFNNIRRSSELVSHVNCWLPLVFDHLKLRLEESNEREHLERRRWNFFVHPFAASELLFVIIRFLQKLYCAATTATWKFPLFHCIPRLSGLGIQGIMTAVVGVSSEIISAR